MSLKLKQISIIAIFLCCVILVRYFISVVGKAELKYRLPYNTEPQNLEKFGKGYKFLESNEVNANATAQLKKESTEKEKETVKELLIENNTFENPVKAKEALAKYDIILSAYQHSGSTVTGRLFSERDDTFYIYEPLWQVAMFRFYKGKCLFCNDFAYSGNDNCMQTTENCTDATPGLKELVGIGGHQADRPKIWKTYHKTLEESMAFLQGIFDCRLSQFVDFFYDPAKQRTKFVHMVRLFYSGHRWAEFMECRKVKKLPFEHCLRLAEKVCKEADHRVIKSLRVSLDNVTPLLKTNPQLKVVHLFRDPRGIFNSRAGKSLYNHLDEKNFLRVRSAIKTTCERELIDFAASEMLRAKYPDRFKVIQYEHLYAEPMYRGVKDLYEFAGIDYGNEQQLARQLNISTGRESEFNPFKYRTTLPWKVVDLFNTECSEVLDRLGYTRFKNQSHLEDQSQSAFSGLPRLKRIMQQVTQTFN